LQRRQEGRRQVIFVGAGRGPGVDRARLGDQVAQGADRPGRGGDHQARIGPQAQAEAQHGQGLGGLGPGAELVGPGGVELGPAQASGSSAEKAWATAPFETPGRLRLACHDGPSPGG
jgi:hypothetical protein